MAGIQRRIVGGNPMGRVEGEREFFVVRIVDTVRRKTGITQRHARGHIYRIAVEHKRSEIVRAGRLRGDGDIDPICA